jgi:hypothetical protein
LAWALAGYATARKQEIRVLDWTHVDLKLGAVELAADEEGRKPGGSWRVVPRVNPLKKMLRDARLAQGQPTAGKVCPPRQASPSGLLALGDIQARVHGEWRALGLEPIGLHESRHRGNVARPCRRRRRVDHPPALHAHAPWRARSGLGVTRSPGVSRTWPTGSEPAPRLKLAGASNR